MDRTAEFVEFLPSSSSRLSALARSRCASPFVLKAGKVLEKIASFEKIVSQLYVEYVHGQHGISLRRDNKSSGDQGMHTSARMSESERNEFKQEITLFIAAVASELNDLKYMIGASTSDVTIDLTWLQSLSPLNRAHYQEIVAFVSTKLSAFTKQMQLMHRERKRVCVDPLRLHIADYEMYSV